METSNEPLDQGQFQPKPVTEYDGMVQDDLNAQLVSVASWFYWVVGPQIIALGFHAFVIYKLSRGFGILKEAKQISNA